MKRGHLASLLTFAYVPSALVGSRCLRQLADRWPGDGFLRDEVAEGRRLGADDWSRLLARFGFRPLMRIVFPELEHLSWQQIKRRILRLVQQLHVEKRGMRILLPPDEEPFRRILIRNKLETHPLPT